MRIPLLALALLVACAISSHAQRNCNLTSGTSIPDGYGLTKGPQFTSPAVPNQKYPLRVSLHLKCNIWDNYYGYYAGEGKLELASTTPYKPIDFEYQCGVTFLKPKVNQFQARWIKPDKSLQILLYDPDRPNKPRTCNLDVLAHPPQKIPY
jgi:hypothetical protein